MDIAICDDNKRFASELEEVILKKYVDTVKCEVFFSGDELYGVLEKGEKYQIYFLDIEMEGINGIETALRIRKDDDNALIIFMTEHQEYVYRVFEALPFRFLIKPFTEEKICKVMNECLEQINTSGKYFFFSVERRKFQLPYGEIIYFEGRKRKIAIHTINGEQEYYAKISDLENELDSVMFCRIHNSLIVNMDYIRSIDERNVLLSTGEILPVSKPYRQLSVERHLKFISWKSGV